MGAEGIGKGISDVIQFLIALGVLGCLTFGLGGYFLGKHHGYQKGIEYGRNEAFKEILKEMR